MKKMIRDGKVAVLVSIDFGGGWYSWNSESEELLFDPIIVDAVENNLPFKSVEEYLEKTYPDNCYFGGYRDLVVNWIPENTKFRIDEYDGAESLVTLDIDRYHTA